MTNRHEGVTASASQLTELPATFNALDNLGAKLNSQTVTDHLISATEVSRFFDTLSAMGMIDKRPMIRKHRMSKRVGSVQGGRITPDKDRSFPVVHQSVRYTEDVIQSIFAASCD